VGDVPSDWVGGGWGVLRLGLGGRGGGVLGGWGWGVRRWIFVMACLGIGGKGRGRRF